MSVSSLYLPLELVEQIFEELSSASWQDLKSCGLACHGYLVLARRFLFRSVTITLDGLGDDATEPSFPLLSFLASNSQVSACVRDLQVGQSMASGNPETMPNWTSASIKLADILPVLTGLDRLMVSFIWDRTQKDNGIRQVLMRFFQIPALRHLEIRFLGLTADELLGLIRIPKLTLFQIDWTLFDLDPVPLESSNILIPSTARLQDLTISLPTPRQAEKMFNVAKAAGTTLKSLKWTSSPLYISMGTCLCLIDLRTLPHLTFLSVSTPLQAENILDLSKMLECLSTQSKLEILEIACDYYTLPRPDLISNWDWQRLETVLISTTHPALKKVHIVVKKCSIRRHAFLADYGAHCREALLLFESKLPILRSRGIISGL